MQLTKVFIAILGFFLRAQRIWTFMASGTYCQNASQKGTSIYVSAHLSTCLPTSPQGFSKKRTPAVKLGVDPRFPGTVCHSCSRYTGALPGTLALLSRNLAACPGPNLSRPPAQREPPAPAGGRFLRPGPGPGKASIAWQGTGCHDFQGPSSPDKATVPPAGTTWELGDVKGKGREQKSRMGVLLLQDQLEQTWVFSEPGEKAAVAAPASLCRHTPALHVPRWPAGALGVRLSLSGFPVAGDPSSLLPLELERSQLLKGRNYLASPFIPKSLVPTQRA